MVDKDSTDDANELLTLLGQLGTILVFSLPAVGAAVLWLRYAVVAEGLPAGTLALAHSIPALAAYGFWGVLTLTPTALLATLFLGLTIRQPKYSPDRFLVRQKNRDTPRGVKRGRQRLLLINLTIAVFFVVLLPFPIGVMVIVFSWGLSGFGAWLVRRTAGHLTIGTVWPLAILALIFSVLAAGLTPTDATILIGRFDFKDDNASVQSGRYEAVAEDDDRWYLFKCNAQDLLIVGKDDVESIAVERSERPAIYSPNIIQVLAGAEPELGLVRLC